VHCSSWDVCEWDRNTYSLSHRFIKRSCFWIIHRSGDGKWRLKRIWQSKMAFIAIVREWYCEHRMHTPKIIGLFSSWVIFHITEGVVSHHVPQNNATIYMKRIIHGAIHSYASQSLDLWFHFQCSAIPYPILTGIRSIQVASLLQGSLIEILRLSWEYVYISYLCQVILVGSACKFLICIVRWNISKHNGPRVVDPADQWARQSKTSLLPKIRLGKRMVFNT